MTVVLNQVSLNTEAQLYFNYVEKLFGSAFNISHKIESVEWLPWKRQNDCLKKGHSMNFMVLVSLDYVQCHKNIFIMNYINQLSWASHQTTNKYRLPVLQLWYILLLALFRLGWGNYKENIKDAIIKSLYIHESCTISSPLSLKEIYGFKTIWIEEVF